MGKIAIINGSHRAPISNSRRYGKILMRFLKTDAQEFLLNKNNYDEISKEVFLAEKIVLIFPLYVDCLPSILLGFLNRLEKLGEKYKGRPEVYLLVNCGFIESEHTEIAIRIMEYYLKKNDFEYGGALRIGSGESILDSPFRWTVAGKIKAFARAIDLGEKMFAQIQMPIPKGFFIRVANKYWALKGTAHGKNRKEMETMEIK